jgi:hypothetical protein
VDLGPLPLREGSYDEQVYIRALPRRRSPLWLAITSLSLPEAKKT